MLATLSQLALREVRLAFRRPADTLGATLFFIVTGSLFPLAVGPDPVLRYGIRRLCADRLREESAGGVEVVADRMAARIAGLREVPVLMADYACPHCRHLHHDGTRVTLPTHGAPR